MPERIQRKRTKDWRMPEGAVYVGRPTRWGNRYKRDSPHPGHGWPMSREEAVRLYREWFDHREPGLKAIVRRELRGKDLVCWCPLDQPCHADVLLELANA